MEITDRRGRRSIRSRRAPLALRLLLALAGSGLAGSAAEAGSNADLRSLLEETPSPGSIALLWEHSSKPGVVEKLAAALRDGDPRTRAAAARVANVSRSGTLLSNLGAALETETDLDAAGEEIRAIGSLGGAAGQETILRAIGRFDGEIDGVTAEMIARGRGAEAIDWYFGAHPPLHLSKSARARFFRLSSRGSAAVLSSAASRALDAGDEEAWDSILEVARGARVSLERPLHFAALRHSKEAIRLAAAWTLLNDVIRKPPDDPNALLASLDAAGAAAVPGPEEALAFELIARAVGRASVENDARNEWLRTSAEGRFDAIDLRWRAAHMTEHEKEILEKRTLRINPWWTQYLYLLASRPAAEPGGEGSAPPAWIPGAWPHLASTVGGFPRGFASGVVARTKCRPAKEWELATAEIEFDSMGRPAVVHLDPGWQPGDRCQQAAEALFACALDVDGDADPARLEPRILFLHDDFISCLDPSGEEGPPRMPTVWIDASVQPPKRVRKADPIYPEEARRRREEGKVILETVISRAGCVEAARVLKTKAPFTSAALDAVSHWRYEPARQDGRPVRVFMTVVVDFKLRW